MNLGSCLSAAAARNPRKTAIVFENEPITYKQLEHSSTSLARWLLRHGCKPEGRGAIHWPNSIEMIELLFACFKAGMIAVPVTGELQQHAVQSLADFKVPEKIIFVPSLPKGVTGEIQRRSSKGNVVE